MPILGVLSSSYHDPFFWTQRTLPISIGWSAIASDGTNVVATGYTLTERAVYSTDGINWSTSNMPDANGYQAIAYGAGLFVANATNSSVTATSPTGATWTQRSNLAVSSWYGLCMRYNGSIFLELAYNSANRAAYSSNGITWTDANIPGDSGQAVWNRLGVNGSLFLAVNASANTYAATTTNGSTWTVRTKPAVSEDFGGLCGNGTTFVALVSGSTRAYTTTDGSSWTLRTTPSAVSWSDVCWNGTNFVAIAYGSSIAATSPTGATWTQRSTGYAGNFAAIASSNTMTIAVANNDSIYVTMNN
jgi:hypothetical protein